MVRIIDYRTAIEFLLPRHYSGRKPQIKWAFGYYQEDKLVSVISIGKPASNALCKGVCGEKFSSNVYELNRICVDGAMDISLSCFVAQVLKELKKENIILISYADTDMGHIGTIYKATNWLYTGQTKERTDKWTEGNRHSRHYNKKLKEEYRKVRSAKHRYIYFCTNKNTKKEMLRNLNYKIEENPKGESKRYVLGEFQEPKIIKVNVY